MTIAYPKRNFEMKSLIKPLQEMVSFVVNMSIEKNV
jgi:hypothetical protein